jgi:stage II sporulation protein AA (anti-sigma F factor antagonist)
MSSRAQLPHPAPGAEQLSCDVSRDANGARVRLVGALDLAAIPILEAEFAELRGAGIRRVVLDLSTLGFLDSTGLRFILERDREARQDGFSLFLVAGPPAVQRVFDLTGTTACLPFIDA